VRLADRKLSKWEIDERNHLIRTLASLTTLSKECLDIARHEQVIPFLLTLLPTPRTELGEITATSVILPPKEAVPALLVGNTAKCLLTFADDAEIAPILFGDRSLIGIEKLICTISSCSDLRVRKNVAILLAKGCRNKEARAVVNKLKGMQMLIELQDQIL
jgi:hypothetical protein